MAWYLSLQFCIQLVDVKVGFHPRSDQLDGLHPAEATKDNILSFMENLIISQWSHNKSKWNMGGKVRNDLINVCEPETRAKNRGCELLSGTRDKATFLRHLEAW